MVDYISKDSGSKAPMVLGILVVAVVVVLGLVAFGSGVGETDLSPGTELVAPEATVTAPVLDGSAAPVIE